MDPSRYRPINTSFVHRDQNMDVTDVVSTVTSEREAHHSFASGRMMRPSLGGVEHRISRLGTCDQDMSACLASSDVTTAVRRPVGYTFAARTAPRRRSEGTDGRPERTIAELHGGERVQCDVQVSCDDGWAAQLPASSRGGSPCHLSDINLHSVVARRQVEFD